MDILNSYENNISLQLNQNKLNIVLICISRHHRFVVFDINIRVLNDCRCLGILYHFFHINSK